MSRFIRIQKLTMVCNNCMKDQDKITWFDSGSHNWFDGAFYCKPCWRKYFLLLPEEKRKEWQWK